MIFYLAPDLTTKSAGIRILYRHVEILCKNGIPAAILHNENGFVWPDGQSVPVRYLSVPGTISADDIVVVPEGIPSAMNIFKDLPVRKMAVALNWRYAYAMMPNGVDWRQYNIERILTHSPYIGDYLTWAMRLPSHVFMWAIKPEYYFYDRAEKQPQICFILRKQQVQEELARLLWSRNPAFVERIKWVALDNLSEADYAAQIRRSTLFLNLSDAEGLPCSLLEAMRAGTLVAGYNSVGGKRELIGSGEKQNCLLVENLDYPALAQAMEPLLMDMISGDLNKWEAIRKNAMDTSLPYNVEAEEQSVLAMWRQLLNNG